MRKPAWAMTVVACSSAALPARAAGQVDERVGVQQVQRGQLAVARRPRRCAAASRPAARRREPGAGVRQHADLAQPAAVGVDGNSQQAGAVAAARGRGARRRSAARAPPAAPRGAGGQALAPEDHDVLAGVAQQRRASARTASASSPAACARRSASERRRRRRRLERASRKASPAPGAKRDGSARVGVERRRAARGDRELDAVAAHALADAQVEDRRVVDRLGVEHEHGVGELEVGDRRLQPRARRARACSSRGSVPPARESRSAEPSASRSRRCRRKPSSFVVSPPASAPTRPPARLSAGRGLVERALPGDRRAARRRRAAAAAVMRSSTWIAW